MKKFLVILLIASSLFTVIGCSGGSDAGTSGANAASPEALPSTNPEAFTSKPEDK